MWNFRPGTSLAAALLTVALVALACGGEGDRPEGFPLDSGVQGQVTIGPMCPAVQDGTPCPDEPYQALIVIIDDQGEEVIAFESRAIDGRFRMNLWPGRYTLLPESPNPGAPPSAGEQQFEVQAGTFTQVAIIYDSGIR